MRIQFSGKQSLNAANSDPKTFMPCSTSLFKGITAKLLKIALFIPNTRMAESGPSIGAK